MELKKRPRERVIRALKERAIRLYIMPRAYLVVRTFSIELTSTRFGYSEGDLTIVIDYCGDRIDVKARTRELMGLKFRSYYFSREGRNAYISSGNITTG